MSTSPAPNTPAWLHNTGFGSWGHPGWQVLDISAPLSAEQVLLRDGILMGLARWMTAPQEMEERGMYTGPDGNSVSVLLTAAGSWPSWWPGSEREGSGPEHSSVGKGGGHQRSFGERTYAGRALQMPWASCARCSGPLWGTRFTDHHEGSWHYHKSLSDLLLCSVSWISIFLPTYLVPKHQSS